MVNWKELPEHLKDRISGQSIRKKNPATVEDCTNVTVQRFHGQIEVKAIKPSEWSQRSGMNKTEAAYGRQLEIYQQLGLVAWSRFEAIKLRLASKAFYTPDFLVIMPDGRVELHEVKGFWRDDARLKIKVAAEQFPMFRFVAVKLRKNYENYRHGYGWEREEF